MSFSTNACFAPLLADPEISALFSTEATLEGMLRFEEALTRSLAKCRVVDQATADQALAAMRSFQPDMEALTRGVARDGLPVPEWARQLKAHAGDSAAGAIHIGATSQDLLDTCQSIALKQANGIIGGRISRLIGALDELTARFGNNPLMGRTRMQAALPVTVADRIGLWQRPMVKMLSELETYARRVEVLQFAGPVGLRDRPEEVADAVAQQMARELDLHPSPRTWHAEREDLVAYGQFLARVSGTLGKMGQDVALMAQQGLDEVRIAGAGVSSAMPHKQNPVLAETLVALARFSAIQSGGLAQVLVHEQERSGAAWTLEWLLLPPMVETAATSVGIALELAGQIEAMGTAS